MLCAWSSLTSHLIPAPHAYKLIDALVVGCICMTNKCIKGQRGSYLEFWSMCHARLSVTSCSLSHGQFPLCLHRWVAAQEFTFTVDPSIVVTMAVALCWSFCAGLLGPAVVSLVERWLQSTIPVLVSNYVNNFYPSVASFLLKSITTPAAVYLCRQ